MVLGTFERQGLIYDSELSEHTVKETWINKTKGLRGKGKDG